MTEPSKEAVEARVNLLETALAIAREHVRLYGGEGKHLELVSLLKQAVDGPHLEPRHVRALLAFGDTAFGPAELDDDHDEALALLRGGALDLKHDLSAIRNRWEQEVRERLLSEGGVYSETAISRAKSSYAAVKPAADSMFDDTGWDEPWEAAMEAAVSHALDSIFEEAELVNEGEQ